MPQLAKRSQFTCFACLWCWCWCDEQIGKLSNQRTPFLNSCWRWRARDRPATVWQLSGTKFNKTIALLTLLGRNVFTAAAAAHWRLATGAGRRHRASDRSARRSSGVASRLAHHQRRTKAQLERTKPQFVTRRPSGGPHTSKPQTNAALTLVACYGNLPADIGQLALLAILLCVFVRTTARLFVC